MLSELMKDVGEERKETRQNNGFFFFSLKLKYD